MKDKFINELLIILQKFIPNIDIQNPIIKYHINALRRTTYFPNLLFSLQCLFQIYNCQSNFNECLKEIYALQIKYSDIKHETLKSIKIDLSADISIPSIESLIYYFNCFR